VRPSLYIVIVIAAVLAAFVYDLRTKGIFACPGAGYANDSYLANCNSAGYGEYDHGAWWFDLEPVARRRADDAEVLFLGSSKMQFGLSTSATAAWFDEHDLRYYLLGFAYTENVIFAAPLLAKLSPSAAAYVVNADGFFDDRETPPVVEIFHGGALASPYRRKLLWQYPHRILCGTFSRLCGSGLAFFRSRDHGTWTLQGTDALVPTNVQDVAIKDAARLERSVALAEEFVAKLPVERRCVFLTVVPSVETPRAEATTIADALGVKLLAPRADDSRTFDGSHLDVASAERWSREFFDLAGPEIRGCLDTASSAAR